MNNEEANNSPQSSNDNQNQQTTTTDSSTTEPTPKPLETRLTQDAHDFRAVKWEKPPNNESMKPKDSN
jgi:hypothetical protein